MTTIPYDLFAKNFFPQKIFPKTIFPYTLFSQNHFPLCIISYIFTGIMLQCHNDLPIRLLKLGRVIGFLFFHALLISSDVPALEFDLKHLMALILTHFLISERV
ncbi:hypothetical protein C0J52_07367 [Blattella germanica]|nr:hypothetical protein C0J52_07367 [Blattella germanica]